MGHLIRTREVLVAADQLTSFDIPESRKVQFSNMLDKVETLINFIEARWGNTVLGRAIVLNMRDWISKVRATRFATPTATA
jgi:hypothetical protein